MLSTTPTTISTTTTSSIAQVTCPKQHSIKKLIVKNSFILIIDLLCQCWTKLKVNIKIFISTPLHGTPERALWRHIPSPRKHLQEQKKSKNEISSQFQLNKKPVSFDTVTVEEDILCEKSCQTYFLKKWSVSNFFKHFVVNLWNKIFLWKFWR